MTLVNCFKYLHLNQISVGSKTFVRLKIKSNVNYYSMTYEKGDLTSLIDYAFNIEGIVVIRSSTMVQSTFELRNPKGIVCVENILFNTLIFPVNVIPLTSSTTVFKDIINHIFGDHIGCLIDEKIYIAMLREIKIPLLSSLLRSILTETENISAFLDSTIDYFVVAKSLCDLIPIFERNCDKEWWTLYFKVLDTCVDMQSAIELHSFDNIYDHIARSEWKMASSNMKELCEICLTVKHDLGIVFNASSEGHIQYISTMLTCFSCYTSTRNGIKDTLSYQTCTKWLPLYESFVGMYLMQKCGNGNLLTAVIVQFLNQQFLTEKELYIVECLLNMFKAFHRGVDFIAQNLYLAIECKNDNNNNFDFVPRLTSISGTLKERLYTAYSNPSVML